MQSFIVPIARTSSPKLFSRKGIQNSKLSNSQVKQDVRVIMEISATFHFYLFFSAIISKKIDPKLYKYYTCLFYMPPSTVHFVESSFRYSVSLVSSPGCNAPCLYSPCELWKISRAVSMSTAGPEQRLEPSARVYRRVPPVFARALCACMGDFTHTHLSCRTQSGTFVFKPHLRLTYLLIS